MNKSIDVHGRHARICDRKTILQSGLLDINAFKYVYVLMLKLLLFILCPCCFEKYCIQKFGKIKVNIVFD